jgi:FkbM family methyltransferase
MKNLLNLKSQKVKIGNKNYTVSSDDDYLNHIGNDFEPEMCRLFSSLIKDDFNILDIGANIGCTSLLFSEIGKSVHSFEPSPTTFKILSKNTADSGAANIKLHNFGLGARNEVLELTFAPNNRSGGFVSDLTQASDGHTIEKIEIKKGDDYLLNENFNFIKIDVEGYEKNVIEGMTHIIDKQKPIIVMELNHWCLNAFQRTSIPDFFDFLLERFPTVYAVDGENYLDIRNPSHRYIVMYHHIINFKYPNLVLAFDPFQLEKFHSMYCNGA